MKTNDLISIEQWRQAQGQTFADSMDAKVQLGPIYSDSWLRDPKHLVFALSRYKFVSKMLEGEDSMAEVGAGDGWASSIVGPNVVHYDIAPLSSAIRCHDIMADPLPRRFNAIYALDVLEHVASGTVFFRNLVSSLHDRGRLIVGTPSLEGQTYASEPSRRLHINCMSGEGLRSLAKRFFHHVFMFSMNDEVVHTGFMPMAHYLFALCAEPRHVSD